MSVVCCCADNCSSLLIAYAPFINLLTAYLPLNWIKINENSLFVTFFELIHTQIVSNASAWVCVRIQPHSRAHDVQPEYRNMQLYIATLVSVHLSVGFRCRSVSAQKPCQWVRWCASFLGRRKNQSLWNFNTWAHHRVRHGIVLFLFVDVNHNSIITHFSIFVCCAFILSRYWSWKSIKNTHFPYDRH